MYWVFDNNNHEYATVHVAECTFCDHGRGLHRRGIARSDAARWLGPFEEFAEAMAAARATGRRTTKRCKVCAPA
jgi:F-type H+/Na+-transporting ATPase subunit beta